MLGSSLIQQSQTEHLEGDGLQPAFQEFLTSYLPHIALCLLLICLGQIAWTNRFIQDDAFISFRYADNLVHGKGLTWNEGDKVEGYTNFLWTMIMTIPFMVNIDVVVFAYVLGLVIFTANLALTYRLAVYLFSSPWISLLCIFLLGTNYTFSCYATGGLETGLQTFFFLLAVLGVITFRSAAPHKPYHLFLISCVFSFALLTRLDSAILLLATSPFLIKGVIDTSHSSRETLRNMLFLSIPAVLFIGSWLLWKSYYYGDILPNTYYAKVSNSSSFRGMLYLYGFFSSYWLIPFVFLILASADRFLRKESSHISIIATLAFLWCFYLVHVGGDFMEFRFLVPILPFMIILAAWLIFRVLNQRALQVALALLIFMGSIHHYITFSRTSLNWEIESIQELHGHLTHPWENWGQVGIVLRDLFEGSQSDVIIATTAAGAIPFYSRLPTVDMHGLNDSWIARHGRITGNRPGHQRRASLQYLRKRKVNLILGHPQIEFRAETPADQYNLEDIRRFSLTQEELIDIPPDAQILEIPINDEYRLLALYLTPNPTIDRTILAERLKTYPIRSS